MNNTSDGLEKDVTDRLIELISLAGKLLFDIRRNKIFYSISNNISSSELTHELSFPSNQKITQS